MKKGIVMEQHRHFIIVMTPDGTIEKANPIEGVEIGFETYYEPFVPKRLGSIWKQKFFSMRVAALACVFLIALIPLYTMMNGSEAYAYVDIDINPSIELEINDDLEVSSLKPLNEDAENLLGKMEQLKGVKIDDAIDQIIQASEENGYSNPDKNVLVGVHYVAEAKDETSPVLDAIDKHFSNVATAWQVVTVEIPEEVRVEAEKKKQSMNEVLAKQVIAKESLNEEEAFSDDDRKALESFYNRQTQEAKSTEKKVSPSAEENKPAMVEEKNTSIEVEEKAKPSESKENNRNKIPGQDKKNENASKHENHGKNAAEKTENGNNKQQKAENGQENSSNSNSKNKKYKKSDEEEKSNEKSWNNGNNGIGNNNGNQGNHHDSYGNPQKNNQGNNQGNGHEGHGNGQGNGNGKHDQFNFFFGVPGYK